MGLVQLVEHPDLDLWVVSSSLTLGVEIIIQSLKKKIKIKVNTQKNVNYFFPP